MEFVYSRAFGDSTISDSYERLLLDAMLGDSTLFIRRDETELAWDRVTNVLEGWGIQEEILRRRGKTLPLPQYDAGTWGPIESDDLLAVSYTHLRHLFWEYRRPHRGDRRTNQGAPRRAVVRGRRSIVRRSAGCRRGSAGGHAGLRPVDPGRADMEHRAASA